MPSSSFLHSRRILLRVLLAGAVAAFPSLLGHAQPPAPPAPPSTILLIRHGEKPPAEAQSVDLSPAGLERANRLKELFAPPHNLPRPDLLFATHASKKSNREVETLIPLSKALSLPISADVEDKDFAMLATELLSGKYSGKVLLVCWHHGSLPQFAKALGVTPPYDHWPDAQFDRVWRIDYTAAHTTLTEIPESLMPGDAASNPTR